MQALSFGPGGCLYLASVAVTSIVLCAAALVTARLLRRPSAPLRHGLLLSAVCLTALSPLWIGLTTSLGLAGWRIGPPVDRVDRDVMAPVDEDLPGTIAPQPVASRAPVVEAPAQNRAEAHIAPAQHWLSAVLRSTFRWQVLILGVATVWMAGILLRLVALGRGLLTLGKLRRSLVPIEDERAVQLFGRVLSEIGVPAVTPLLQSRLAPAPLTCGLFRPIVVLPTGLADTWNDEQLRLVLAHEAAHIARRDLYAAAIQWLAGTLFWWNLLLHAVNRRIERLREHICDDYAVQLSGNGRGLAEVLVALAEWAPSHGLRMSGATAIVDRAYDDLESRISRLVQDRPICMQLSWPMRCGLAGFVVGLVALLHLTTWGADADPGGGAAPQAAGGLVTLDNQPVDKEALMALAKTDRPAFIRAMMKLGVFCTQDSNTGLTRVIISDFNATDATVALLEPLDNIGDLTLIPGKYTEGCLDTVVNFKKLNRLDISQLAISGEGMAKLGSLPELKWLRLFNCAGLTDSSLRWLKKFKALEILHLDGQSDQITDKGCEILGSLPLLKNLQLAGNSITDEGLQRLAQSKSLSVLHLNGNAFSDEGLRFLAGMESLEQLHLINEKITAQGIRHLKTARHLQSLYLANCPRLDDDSLAAVAELANLRHLTLGGNSMTDDGLFHLNGLVDLQSLGLTGAQFTGAGLVSLTALVNLTNLGVTGESASNALFAHLHQFPKLNILNVGAGKPTDHPRITDDGLKSIGSMPSLTMIIFVGTGVTDRGFESLAALPKLQSVTCNWSTGTKTMIWQPSEWRKKLAAERQAADPAGAEQSEKIIAKLREMKVRCTKDQGSGKLKVTIPNVPDANDATMALLERVSNIGELTLGPGRFTDASFDSIGKLTDLEKLTMWQVMVSDSAIEQLTRLPLLASLELRNCAVTDEKLRILKACPALSHLAILGRNDRITPAGFEHLASMASLENLNLVVDSITDEGLTGLAQSESISSLALDSEAFSDEGLRSIAGMKNLGFLSLHNGKMSAAGLRQLKSAPRLAMLALDKCPQLDDDSLVAVGEFSNLSGLWLGGSSMTDEGLAHLNGLVGLRRLSLENPRFTGAGLKSLTALVELTELTVFGEQVANDVFVHLHQFPKLDTVHLGAGRATDHPGITDEGLKLIENVPKLRELYFEGTALTEQGLNQLRLLPQVNNAYVFNSPGVAQWHWTPKTRLP